MLENIYVHEPARSLFSRPARSRQSLLANLPIPATTNNRNPIGLGLEPLEPRVLLTAAHVNPLDAIAHSAGQDPDPIVTLQIGQAPVADSQTAAIVDIPVAPFESVGLNGGLAYVSEANSGQIDFLNPADQFEIDLDSGQTLTVTIDPDPTLQPSVDVLGPDGSVIAHAAAALPGDPFVLQAIPITQQGTYTIEIAGQSGSFGAYSAQFLLNASAEDEAFETVANDTLDSAQDLNPSFISLGGAAQHAAVVGSLSKSSSSTEVIDSEDFESGILGAQWETSSSLSTGRIQVTGNFGAADGSGLALLMDNNVPFFGGFDNLNEAVWTVDLSGVEDPALSFWHANWGDEITPFFGDFTGSFNADGVAISDDGVNWHPVFSPSSGGFGVWEQIEIDLAAQATLAGMTLGSDFQIKFQQFDNVNLTVDGRGYDQIQITGTPSGGDDSEDWYRFTLDQGETTTLALDGDATVQLFDADGNELATAVAADNADQVIDGFASTSAQTYFVRVSGQDVDYHLVVTRNAAFDLEPNDDPGSAQDISTTHVALGSLGAVEDTDTGDNPPPTGITSLPTLLNDGDGFLWDISNFGEINDGTSDAYDGGLFHSSFGFFTSAGTEDSSREVVIGPDASSGGIEVTRKIFVPDDGGFARFLEIVTNTSASAQNYTVSLFTNLGSDSSTQLIGTSDGDLNFSTADHWLVTDDFDFSGDPTIVHVTSGPGAAGPTFASLNLDDIAYAYDLVLAPGQTQVVMHFASQNTNQASALSKATQLTNLELGALEGLSDFELARIVNFDVDPGGSDEEPDESDHYSFFADAGDLLAIEATLPGAGLGAFENDLDVAIELFDPSGASVALDAGGSLSHVATTSGTYIVKLSAENDTTGEYILTVTPNPGQSAPINDFQRVKPLGGLMSASIGNTGSLAAVGEADRFEFPLDGGQTVSAVVTPDDPDAIVTLELNGNVFTSPAPGQPAVLTPLTIGATENVVLTVSGDAATGYSLDVYRNASLEAAVGDSDADNALAIDDSRLDLGSSRLGVIGSSQPEGVTDGVIFSQDFEAGLGGFVINGLWHLSQGRSSDGDPNHSPPNSLYYGQGEGPLGGGNFDTGATNSGTVISPLVSLPNAGPIELSFNFLLQTEGSTFYDAAELAIDAGGGFQTLLSTTDNTLPSNGTGGAWQTATADLTGFAGNDITLRWSFNTIDSIANGFEGWYLDDILITGPTTDPDPDGDLVLYGAATGTNFGGDFGSLYRINPLTGDATLIGPTGFNGVSGMTFLNDGRLVASALDPITFNAVLIEINPTTGSGSLIGSLEDPFFGNVNRVPDLGYDAVNDILYGYSNPFSTGGILSVIDPNSADTALIGPTGFFGGGNGMDVDPVSGTLFATPSGNFSLVTIDPITGFANEVSGSAGNVPDRVNALDFNPETGVLFGSWNDNINTGIYSLVNIDTSDGSTTVIGQTVSGLDALAWGPEFGAGSLSGVSQANAGAVTIVEPDDFPDGTVLDTAVPGVTLSTPVFGDSVFAADAASFGFTAPTGAHVFGNTIYGAQGWNEFDLILVADFDEPVDFVSIDAGSDDFSDVSVLRAFDADGNLLQEVFSSSLSTGQSETLSISRPTADIASIEAAGFGFDISPLDNLQFSSGGDGGDSSGPDTDQYTVNLVAGERVDVILDGLDASFVSTQTTTLELLDIDGSTVLATAVSDPLGVAAGNYDQAILGFEVPADGLYTLRLTSQILGDYGLVVTESLTFDTEPNNQLVIGPAPLRSLDETGAALGFLDEQTGLTEEDFYEITLDTNQTLVLATDTLFANDAANTLDPNLTVINPSGLTIATDDNSGPDARNAQLSVIAPEAGVYRVAVGAVSGSGEYVLHTQVIEPLVVVVESTVITGSATDVVSGFIDLRFEVPDGFDQSLAAYNVELSVDPSTVLSLVGAQEASNPIFPGQTPLVFTSPDPGHVLRVADNLPGIGQANPILDGQDLFRVEFTVDPGFFGTMELGVEVNQIALFDGDAQSIVPVEIVPGLITVVDPGPQVVEVLVSGSQWSPSVLNEVDPDHGIGFAIPHGGFDQLVTLPWVNLDQVSIRFNEPVTVEQDDLALHGVNVPRYTLSGFSYDPVTFTATWTLALPNQPGGVVGIGADKLLIDLFEGVTDLAGNALDGEWENPVDFTQPSDTFPSGDGEAGGNFRFRFNVLPGNVDEPLAVVDGQFVLVSPGVEPNDTQLVQAVQFSTPGAFDYSPFLDVNADGVIFGDDVILTRNRESTSLPVADPAAPDTTFTISDQYDLTLDSVTIGPDGAIEGQVGYFASPPFINGTTPPPGSPFGIGWPAPQITTVAAWEFEINDPDALDFFFANPTTTFNFQWSWTFFADFTDPDASGVPASFTIKKQGTFADLFPPSGGWVDVTVEFAGQEFDAYALLGIDAPNNPDFFEIGFIILATEQLGMFFPPGTPDGATAFITAGHSNLHATPTAGPSINPTVSAKQKRQQRYQKMRPVVGAALESEIEFASAGLIGPETYPALNATGRARKLNGSAVRLRILSDEVPLSTPDDQTSGHDDATIDGVETLVDLAQDV